MARLADLVGPGRAHPEAIAISIFAKIIGVRGPGSRRSLSSTNGGIHHPTERLSSAVSGGRRLDHLHTQKAD